MNRRGPFARSLLLGALVAVAVCSGLTALVEVRQALSLPDRFVDVIVPLLALAILFFGTWRVPLRNVGYPAAGRVREFLLWMIAGTFAGAIIFLQVGMPLALADLEVVDGPAALAAKPHARFVKVKAFDVVGDSCRPAWDFSDPVGSAGSRSSSVTASVYVACRIVGVPDTWSVLGYSESVRRADLADDARREKALGAMVERARADVDGQLPATIPYFERLRGDRAARAVKKAIGEPAASHAALFLAAKTPYEKQGIGFLYASAVCALLFVLLALVVPLSHQALEDAEEGEGAAVAPGGDAPPAPVTDAPAATTANAILRRFAPKTGSPFDIFIPGKGAIAAPLLLDLCIIAYLAMTLSGVDPLSPSPDDLLRWGANQKTALLAGQWWRLLTHQFIHIGIIHLFMNAVLLLMAALLLEGLAGWRWTLSTYLVGGVGGGLLSAFTGDKVSAGASGAILALVGALLVLGFSRFSPDRGLGRWAVGLAVANLLIGVKGGVDIAAHAGGLVTGLACGAAIVAVKIARAGANPGDAATPEGTAPPPPGPAPG